MSDSNTPGQMKDFFDQLPTPPKEKVIRGIWYVGLGLVGLAGFLWIMPFINHALTLGVLGASLLLKLGALALVGTVATFVVSVFWPIFKLKVESMARQTTASIFGEDPITPLRMWLAEVRADCEAIERSTNEIDGIIAENEKVEGDNRDLQDEADRNYAAAVKHHGEASNEAHTAAVDAKGYKTRADNAAKVNIPLKALYKMLFEIAQATRLGEREAEMSIGTAEMEWRAALKAEKAMNSAQRSLNKRSTRYVNATMAFDIIRQKYAGSFGQLRSLRRLTEETINRTNLSGDVANDEALQRLRDQSQKLLGYSPAVLAHDFTATPVAASADSSAGGVSNLNLFGEKS